MSPGLAEVLKVRPRASKSCPSEETDKETAMHGEHNCWEGSYGLGSAHMEQGRRVPGRRVLVGTSFWLELRLAKGLQDSGVVQV